MAADKGEYVPDLLIGKRATEGGHVTLVPGGSVWRHQPILNYRKEHVIWVVPRMAGIIVRRRR